MLGGLGHPLTVPRSGENTGQVWVRTPRAVAGYVLVGDASVMSGPGSCETRAEVMVLSLARVGRHPGFAE